MTTCYRLGLAGLVLSFGSLVLGAVRGDDAMYMGGTHSSIPDKTEGRLDLSSPEAAVFQSAKGKFTVPFKRVTSIEYGQKAGRRVGVALAISPVALLSKKRKHFLSVTYSDEGGTKQGAVFELSKGKAHPVIATFEQRSGVKVEFESTDAKKHFEKEAR